MKDYCGDGFDAVEECLRKELLVAETEGDFEGLSQKTHECLQVLYTRLLAAVEEAGLDVAKAEAFLDTDELHDEVWRSYGEMPRKGINGTCSPATRLLLARHPPPAARRCMHARRPVRGRSYSAHLPGRSQQRARRL